MLEAVVALAILSAALAVVTFREWFPTHANAVNRELAMAPRSAIRRIRGGVVAVNGQARTASGLLAGPVSGRPCLAFQVTISVRVPYGWDVIGRFGQAQPFWVADASGRALVDPGEHFALALDQRLITLAAAEASASLREEAQRRAADRALSLAGRELRFQEGILTDGEPVAVAGYAATEPHPRGEREHPRQMPICLVLRGNGFSEPLLISDDPRANGR